MQVQIIIPSRNRPGSVRKVEALFPTALWCIGEDEVGAYKTKNLLVHPRDVVGIGAVRHWILANTERPVVMLDDDISGGWCNVGALGRRIDGPEDLVRIIENTAEIADGVGAPVFGWNQAWDVRKFKPHDPFGVTGWVGTAIGFTRHAAGLEYDQTLLSQADIDFCLKALLKKRLLFIDNRFAFICKRFNNAGGSSSVRSMEQYEAQVKRVVDRWGPWISHKRVQSTYRLQVHVPRRQSLDFEE